MACTSHKCKPQGTAIGPRTPTVWTSAIDAGQRFSIEIVNQLKTALNVELSVRSLAAESWTNLAVGGKVSKQALDQLVSVINNCRSEDEDAQFSWFTDRNVGDRVSNTFLTQLRDNTHTIQKKCICNCNYCTCQCNYCTCDCNYCTCQCDYCACNCDYSCTCNCNYPCTCNCNYSCTCNCNYSCTCNCNY